MPIAAALSTIATALRPRKGDQTRAAIVQAALEAASRDGLEGLTIGTLADQMRMSKSGLFAHFGSREDLQLAVLREYVRRFIDEVLRPAVEEAAWSAAPASDPRSLGRLSRARADARLHRDRRRRRVLTTDPAPARRDGRHHRRLEGRTAEGDTPGCRRGSPQGRYRCAADGVRDLRSDAGDAPGCAPASVRRQRATGAHRARPRARRRGSRSQGKPELQGPRARARCHLTRKRNGSRFVPLRSAVKPPRTHARRSSSRKPV